MSYFEETIKLKFAESEIVVDQFIRLAEKDGFWCQKSLPYQDKYEHWDVRMVKEWQYLVDVKNYKDVSKHHNCTWLEMKNVGGYVGWLYAPKVDAIVFEKPDRFIFIDINDLRALAEKVTKNETIIIKDKPEYVPDLLHKLYSRPGRKDLMTLVSFDDIDIHTKFTFYK